MMMYLLRLSGEIALKSERTRWRFEQKLILNIENALHRRNIRDYKIYMEDGRVFIEGPENLENLLVRIFGVHSVSKAYSFTFKDLSDIVKKADEYFKGHVKGKKFAVRTRRVGHHNFTSIDVNKAVGAQLKQYSAGVDLKNPEAEVFIEIRGNRAYFFTEIIKGYSGLPIGVEGSSLVLFSGGYDSPVASWLVAKRGVEVHFLHYILTSSASALAAYRVAKYLVDNWLFGYEPKFYIIDLRSVVAEIMKKVRNDYKQVVLRKVMYVVADELRAKLGFDTLTTGESIGQASTQTLKNLAIIGKGVRSLILRPLISMEKDEIIKLSKLIGTYELSTEVIEYCSIATGPVTTRANEKILSEELEKIDAELINRSLRNIFVLNLVHDSINKLSQLVDVEIDYIPSNALVVDVRDESEYHQWHYEGSIHISELDTNSLSKDKPVVFYCQTGDISSAFAKLLRDKGFLAFSLRGGISRLKSLCKEM